MTYPANDGEGPFSIGSAVWPGISKLIEECGEVAQVAGKLIGTGGNVNHWDGTNLQERLQDEMADVIAAVRFVEHWCKLDADVIDERVRQKLRLFWAWHMAAS